MFPASAHLLNILKPSSQLRQPTLHECQTEKSNKCNSFRSARKCANRTLFGGGAESGGRHSPLFDFSIFFWTKSLKKGSHLNVSCVEDQCASYSLLPAFTFYTNVPSLCLKLFMTNGCVISSRFLYKCPGFHFLFC